MTTTAYTSVVFCAYVVPTIPLIDQEVGDPDGPGYVGGQYIGLDDPVQDMTARFQLVAAAAQQLYEEATATRNDASVLHVFCIPEFFFRGKQGAYNTKSQATDGGEDDLQRHASKLLRALADQPKFQNWLFVLGTVLESDLDATASPEIKKKAKSRDHLVSAIVKAYKNSPDDEYRDFCFSLLTQTTEFAQKRPLATIQNRCILYKPGSQDYPHGLCIDKKFISHEDFVVSYYAPTAYSELSVAYPTMVEGDSEIKQSAFDGKSIFTMDGITIAVEICLDHRRQRLQTVRQTDRASASAVIDLQLVISCGMQLQQPSIVARNGGPVFNCDGQYSKRSSGDLPDDSTSIWQGTKDGKGHTQFTVVKEAATTMNPKGHTDAVLERPTDVTVTTTPLEIGADCTLDPTQIEAYGAGEVHLYSKFPLPQR